MLLKVKDNVLTTREEELVKLGFQRRYDIYTGKVSYYEGKGSHILLPTGKVEAIWCCGEINEDDYTEDIYNLISNNMVDLIEKVEDK